LPSEEREERLSFAVFGDGKPDPVVRHAVVAKRKKMGMTDIRERACFLFA
jgi:hypothetical protein